MSSESLSVPPTVTVFIDFARVDAGPRDEVLARLRHRPGAQAALVFDDRSGERLDLDLRAGASAAEAGPEAPPARGVGRPKLGVVAREVTLLPRHWDWLSRQPGGASVALRRLIDEARHHYAERDAVRAAREACYRFMSVLAGDLPGFEEAARALFAGERERFEALVAPWPPDVAAHARQLAASGWGPAGAGALG